MSCLKGSLVAPLAFAGGELFDHLLDRGPLTEEVALHIMRQVGCDE
jgi:hypothetical protein